MKSGLSPTINKVAGSFTMSSKTMYDRNGVVAGGEICV